MREEFIASVNGYILVFNVTDINSFEECTALYEEILATKAAKKKIPIVLVGNKCDLENRVYVLQNVYLS